LAEAFADSTKTVEELIEEYKAEEERERAEKRERRQSLNPIVAFGRVFGNGSATMADKRTVTVVCAMLIAVLAGLIIWLSLPNPQWLNYNIEDLSYEIVLTEQQLIDRLSAADVEAIQITADGFAFNNATLFLNDDDKIVAYSVVYGRGDERIEFVNIFTENHVSSRFEEELDGIASEKIGDMAVSKFRNEERYGTWVRMSHGNGIAYLHFRYGSVEFTQSIVNQVLSKI
jgi:hypothetical protein